MQMVSVIQQAFLCCSYTLAGLLELADISLPEDFEEEEREVAISGLQNKSHKVQQTQHAAACRVRAP